MIFWYFNVKHLTVINFVSHDSNHNLEKGPFVYKFVYANLLRKFIQLFNAVVCISKQYIRYIRSSLYVFFK